MKHTCTISAIALTAIASYTTPVAATTTAVAIDHSTVISAAVGDKWVRGKVVRISLKRSKVTIAHAEMPHLGMGAMTMSFSVVDPALLARLSVGDEIELLASTVDGALVLDDARPIDASA